MFEVACSTGVAIDTRGDATRLSGALAVTGSSTTGDSVLVGGSLVTDGSIFSVCSTKAGCPEGSCNEAGTSAVVGVASKAEPLG